MRQPKKRTWSPGLTENKKLYIPVQNKWKYLPDDLGADKWTNS
jgi:hypothetical protein